MQGPPYRAAVSQGELVALTENGEIRLSVAPQHTQIAVGPQLWTVANDHLSVLTLGKRRNKKRSMLLQGTHLYVARAWPNNEISLWIEHKPGVVQRLLGLPPVVGLSHEIMNAWRDLERFAQRLQEALAHYSAGARAFELGNGQHRVFGLRFPRRLVIFARPVFRERPRRVLELLDDRTLVLPVRKKKDRRIPMERGLEIIASGDRISFCQPDGEQVAGLFLPWIAPSDRVELTRRLQATIDAVQGPAPSDCP